MKYYDLKEIQSERLTEIRAAVDGVVQSGWYLQGKATQQFEQHYANYIGTHYCVGCGNGFDALWLILRAYREMGIVEKGDEVIVSAHTFYASILAITENDLVPILVEPNKDTWQIDDQLIEPLITPRTRVVMLVHLYGNCAYTPRIYDICQRHGLRLIEDNAQAHGCRWNGKRTGALGHAAAHSFYPTKNLGAWGDAGAVTTNDEALARMVRCLGNYGSSRKYVFEHAGRNSRMDEIQAAVLDTKLKWLDADNERRREIARIYNETITNPQLTKMKPTTDCVYHIYPILSAHRDALQSYLQTNDVATAIHYPIPPHCQQGLAPWRQSLPITERIHREELSLPCHPAMTDEEAQHVASLLNNY